MEIDEQIIVNIIDNINYEKYVINKIFYDDNSCVCVKCNKKYTNNKKNNFIDYCPECKTTHCFKCGKQHTISINCFEANEDLKKMIHEIYNNSNIELKICPHCFLPQEKLDGCNQMKCGVNFHNNENNKIQGCGMNFDWSKAKKYEFFSNDDININIIDETCNVTQIENNTNNTNNNDVFFVKSKIFVKFILITFIILTSIIVFSCSIRLLNLKNNFYNIKNYNCNKISYTKYIDENFIDNQCLTENSISTNQYLNCYDNNNCWKNRNNSIVELCGTTVDSNFIDLNYLIANNYTIEEYSSCYNNISCWNSGKNIYTKNCIDTDFVSANEICHEYKSFINKHYLSYYCNNKKQYDNISLCKENYSLYLIISLISIFCYVLINVHGVSFFKKLHYNLGFGYKNEFIIIIITIIFSVNIYVFALTNPTDNNLTILYLWLCMSSISELIHIILIINT